MKGQLVRALQASDGPLSAYELLSVLKQTNPKAAPTTVYRTLKALTDDGQVHRLESINAYMLCQSHSHTQDAILSICDDCGTVEETVAPDVIDTVSEAVGKSGFAASRHIFEVHGTCSDCAPETSRK